MSQTQKVKKDRDSEKGSDSVVRYPKVEIDRSFAVEAARRNVDVVLWYKRLINATLGLIVASILFTAIAVLFAFFQPLPRLYGTSLDGSLKRIEYVRNINDPKMGVLRSALTIEIDSRPDAGNNVTIAPSANPRVSAAASGSPSVVKGGGSGEGK